MSDIKTRRLRLPVSCHEDLMVGECTPFYFCPRSIMLYLLHRGNHPNITYQGGQTPIVHLEFDMHEVIEWATGKGRRWAFTFSNAGANYCEASNDLDRLGEINWDAVATNQWSGNGVSRSVKEGKQAEFLIERSAPWQLVRRIGVRDKSVVNRVSNAMAGAKHRPPIEVKSSWYY